MSGLSTRMWRACARSGRAWLFAGALAFVLGAFAPGCFVAPAHAADAAVAASAHSPADDPACCDELRDASSGLAGPAAAPSGTSTLWSPGAVPLADVAPHGARPAARAAHAALGVPFDFTPIPPYLRTLRLRI